MYTHAKSPFICLAPFAILLPLSVASFTRELFDRQYTGVSFSPYIKHLRNASSFASYNTYTRKDIRVMLEVITERFSKVATWRTGSRGDSYFWNFTYYNDSHVEVYTAEIAATINRDRNRKDLTFIQGLSYQDYPQMFTETRLAVECAVKANEIFPGTVEGLVFSLHSALPNKHLLEHMEWIKSSPVGGSLKIGIDTECDFPFADDDVLLIVNMILQISDFIMCKVDPRINYKYQGAAIAFNKTSEILLEHQKQLQQNYSRLQVMGIIKWESEGYNKWENVENLVIYWQSANRWARDNKFPIWFVEAFDNPESFNNLGWWRLTDNSRICDKEGYVEKISELTTTETTTLKETDQMLTTANNDAIVSVSTVLPIMLLILGSLITFLWLRIKKLQQQLSSMDIRDFMEGAPDEAEPLLGDHYMAKLGEKFPYDKSHEIKKDQLKIQHDQLLGTGHFGCVYKAVIEPQSRASKYVALKVARRDSPRSVLKGLLSEIKVMSYIGQHPNILQLCGAYTAELQKGVVFVATEICSFGSLENVLRKALNISTTPELMTSEDTPSDQGSSNTPTVKMLEVIPIRLLFQWSEEIAAGMHYLGMKNVVHADLATRNVLLNADKTAKISDFGLSRRMYNYTNYVKSSQEPLPWRWMSLESLTKCEFSARSDVWSYGVTLWEIFTKGNNPYPGLTWTTSFVSMLEHGMRLERPAFAPPELYEIMLSCWHPEPSERPTFADLHRRVTNVTLKCDRVKEIGQDK